MIKKNSSIIIPEDYQYMECEYSTLQEPEKEVAVFTPNCIIEYANYKQDSKGKTA